MKSILIATLLLAPAATAADLTGRFEPGTKYQAPAEHAPANVSRMFAKTLDAKSTVAELPAAGGSGMIIWTIASGGPVSTRLTTPHGAVLQPGDRGSLDRGLRRFRINAAEAAELGFGRGAQEVVHVLRAAPATYRLDVEMPADGAVTIVAAEPESAVTLSTWAAPLSRQPGQPVTLHAELREGDAAIAGAKVTARLASPAGRAFDAIELLDAGNGIYRATLADLPANVAGAWQVRFEAEGQTGNGVRFARTGAGELVSERGAARLGGIRAEVVGDVVRVSTPADIHIAGSYRYDVIVAGRDNVSLAWAEGARQLEKGTTTLSIDIPLSSLGGTPVEELLLDVRLLGLDFIGVAARTVRAE